MGKEKAVLRRLQMCLVSVLSITSISGLAAAQGADGEAPDEAPVDKPAPIKPAADDAGPTRANARGASPDVTSTGEGSSELTRPRTEVEPTAASDDWHFEAHGYFRAPMALSLSSRPNPDTPDGPAKGQISYAPNRVVDGTYYSFAYTRLQEQDWAEITFHLKKKHVDAAVGWMGYWFSAAGFRNPDAAGVPGVGSLTLDTDFHVGQVKPNIALQMGAWWPSFGYFEKYDTYTLGRFRQIGEQIKLTVPVNSDLKLELVEGFGVGRDGKFDYSVAASSPLYASRVGAILLAYANVQLAYKKYFDVGLHYNNEWSRDPYNLALAGADAGKAYTQAADAHMSVVGAEANIRVPYAGRLWVSPSYISVKNGWALGNVGGTEVMHAQGGLGIANNYLGWSNTAESSTGTGSLLNLGFLYENTLSNILGKAPGSAHDVKLNVFGLLMNATLDLPPQATFNPLYVNRTSIKQFKFGADVSVQALDWMGLMLRGDSVNYDMDNPGAIFSAITARLTVSSHFLSSESIYLQYSRYMYGDKMTLAGQWPWGADLVDGSHVVQGGPYGGQKPDQDVIKLQATAAF
ncbi:MAG: hypothetical protein ABIQ16_05285 [Polyangiaceae bacterium]